MNARFEQRNEQDPTQVNGQVNAHANANAQAHSPARPPTPARRRGLLAAGASAAVLTALAVAGCGSAPTPATYAAEKPLLDLKQYFNGEIVGHGMFTDRSGQVQRRFVVQMTGTWNGKQGTLDERFTYSDGKLERRVWRLTDEGGGRYTGRADDVVGVAIGQAAGNALNWKYTMTLPVDGKVYEVQFDDWMYLVDERVMLNKAVMSKFGFRLGEVTLSFQPK